MNAQDWSSLLRSWNVTPVVTTWLLLAALVYLRGWWRYRKKTRRPSDVGDRFSFMRLLGFLAGLATVFIALQSPLDVGAVFSLQVHMIQHMLLMIVAPPLLLYGTPMLPMIAGLPKSFRRDWVTPFANWKPLRLVFRLIVQPKFAGGLFALSLWIWHAPQLYDLALASSAWHRLEHTFFLTTSILFWWPIFEPYPYRAKRSRWILLPYLVLAGAQGSALAAILTFSQRVLYSHYENTPNVFGISPLTDQSLAGAIMWVPMATAFLIAIVVVLWERFAGEETQTKRTPLAPLRVEGPGENGASVESGSVRNSWFNFLTPKPIRRTLQLILLALAGIVIWDGITGPQVSAINLAGVLPWIHWRGFLVIMLVLGGNFFCMACPFTLFRSTAKRIFQPIRRWPKRLQNKWLAIGLLVTFFWSYEAFALWDRPLATATIVVGYFLAVFIVDALFVEAPFCKFVCPIGQFNFVHSLVSPTQVAVANHGVCGTCTTKSCIAGSESSPGCQTQLFQPKKSGNMDCTFCMDCVDACPHDNVAVFSIDRLENVSLNLQSSPEIEPRETNSAALSMTNGFRRFDVAALIALLFFAALVNAAWMTAQVIAIEQSLIKLECSPKPDPGVMKV